MGHKQKFGINKSYVYILVIWVGAGSDPPPPWGGGDWNNDQ